MPLPNPGARVEVPRAHASALALTVLAGFGVSLALLYPGQYTYDSAFQIWQARSGEFYNITPVPMLLVPSCANRMFCFPETCAPVTSPVLAAMPAMVCPFDAVLVSPCALNGAAPIITPTTPSP